MISTLLSPGNLGNNGTRQSVWSKGTNYNYGWDGSSDVAPHEWQEKELTWESTTCILGIAEKQSGENWESKK